MLPIFIPDSYVQGSFYADTFQQGSLASLPKTKFFEANLLMIFVSSLVNDLFRFSAPFCFNRGLFIFFPVCVSHFVLYLTPLVSIQNNSRQYW